MIHSVQTGNRPTELSARESQLPAVVEGQPQEANHLRPRLRQVIIIGLLCISATAMVAFGFAAHGVARPVRQQGTILAGDTPEALTAAQRVRWSLGGKPPRPTASSLPASSTR